MTVAQKGIVGLADVIDKGLWGPQSNIKIDYFTDVIPSFTDLSATSGVLTLAF